ncbi:ATP-dependent metallopeptidase FtsH/Yme1/Tma family protein [Clostridioides sp. ZZV14-6045]|uniref:ATP-dependent metallopeptidase FtsH/Yme1/Tma family protein n=1 Tax=Clostridioides sp. ZZV14-6045 TaxID=2811489 RepID=UPI001D11480E|nr:ATP-dependent metallopeptidase FtsH/Yme1/Tma family protein [Clostridioides sp. ZZV14-6045]
MKKNKKVRLLIAFLVGLIIAMIVFFIEKDNIKSLLDIKEISYKKFEQMVEKKEVKEIALDIIDGKYVRVKDKKDNSYITLNPKYNNFKKEMLEKNIYVKERKVIKLKLSTIVLIFFLVLMFKSSSLLKNKFDTVAETPEIKFKDVAGLDGAKEDLKLLVDFMKKPKEFTSKGAILPKGAILYGPPGTGKTLIAKAVAGEAGVPFFSINGSDFIELYVGLGAKRVRELFEEAKKKAPAILFIDEIDSIGGKRGCSGENSEQRQTINALLAEIDGFDGSEGVFILCATNRLEDLDGALIRPGRFDKHISIPLPETSEDRLNIIKMYLNKKDRKYSNDLDLKGIANETIGFSPADISSLINESILISIQLNKDKIDKECLDKALYKMLLKGHEKKNRSNNLEELKLISHHEAGHALVAKLMGLEVNKVTIVPSTSGAGGATFITPKKINLHSKKEIVEMVKVDYAGRIAEFLLFNDEEHVTTGCSSDIKNATQKIYGMITEFGMSDTYGMINLSCLKIKSDIVLEAVKKEASRIKEETTTLLSDNKYLLEKIADVLFEKETISGEELESILKENSDYIKM